MRKYLGTPHEATALEYLEVVVAKVKARSAL